MAMLWSKAGSQQAPSPHHPEFSDTCNAVGGQLIIPSVPATMVFPSAPDSCDCLLLMWLLVPRFSCWNATQHPELPP